MSKKKLRMIALLHELNANRDLLLFNITGIKLKNDAFS